MADENATETGSIVGYLKINGDDFDAKLDAAEARSKKLDGTKVTFKVELDNAPVVVAGLQALKTEADSVSDSSTKMNKSVKDANDQAFRPLLTTALLLGPALVPLAVAGAAVAGGLVLGAGSLLLAFKGVNDQITKGTVLGVQFAGGVDSIKNDITKLEVQAAAGVLAPFNQEITLANQIMPTLSGEVHEFAGVTADAAAHLVNGLVSGFITLRPLLTDVIVDVDKGAVGFDNWTQSTGGIVQFMAQARAELPEVEADLSQVLQVVGHLGAAFGTTGLLGLNTIGLVARAINAIPTDQLDHVALATTLMFAAWKGYQVLNLAKDAYDKVSNSVSQTITWMQQSTLATKADMDAKAAAGLKNAAFAVSTDGVAVALTGETAAADAAKLANASAAASAEAAGISMSAALGPIGLVAAGIGILAYAWTSSHGSSMQAKQDVDDYTDALKADNGAIADNTRALAAKKLVDSGAIDDANKLGISTFDLTQALLGNKDAQDRVQAAITASSTVQIGANTEANGTIKTQVALSDAAADLSGKLKDQESAFNSSLSSVAQLKAVYDSLGLTLDGTAATVDTAVIGMSAYSQMQENARASAFDNANQILQTTLNLQAENDAVGLVTAAFDLLNGKGLSAAQAQTALDSATLQLTASLNENGNTVDGATQKGINNQQAIQGVVSALQQQAEATAKTSGSTQQANAAYVTSSANLLDQIAKLDGANSAAYAYAKQLLATPAIVETQAELDTDAAMSQLNAYKAALKAVPQITAALGGGDVNGRVKPALAGGGMLDPSGTFVGDGGTEYVENGRVYSHEQTVAMFGSSVPGPGIGSPAATAVRASYASPTGPSVTGGGSGSSGGPVVAQLTTYVILDGKVVAQSVNEHNMQAGRR